jgi:hypothetical protein
MAAICDERGSCNNAIRESFAFVASVLPSLSDLFLKAKKHNCTKAQKISPPSMIADNAICHDSNVHAAKYPQKTTTTITTIVCPDIDTKLTF